ncbi:hypothetical protein L798_03723 [Zootermopsis nevadensis]|uniref:Uncharacterized protein n=1 Tax=Zootermopsis nevadensis TaxID=136037 RepID=A0A067RMV0_ZOONE|nr:hypothetical protein L798_03723 [Zootermopsis nevadensis]
MDLLRFLSMTAPLFMGAHEMDTGNGDPGVPELLSVWGYNEINLSPWYINTEA